MTHEQQTLVRKAERARNEVMLLIEHGYYESAVSRAYYGMLYLAQAFLLDLGLSFSSHKEAIGSFGREFVKTGRVPRELHRFLIQGQEDRADADYGTQTTFLDTEAKEKLEQLDRFLGEARQL